MTLTQSQFAACDKPLARGLDNLNRSIAVARLHVRQTKESLRNQRAALNRLLARRAEMLDRADMRFEHNMQEPEYRKALEDSLSGDGPLEKKLARAMALADPDEDEEPSDDDDGEDDVLRKEKDRMATESPAPIDYDKEGAEAKAMLQAIHGSDFDQQMERSFADEVERLAAQDIHDALEDATMQDIHGDDDAYCDSNRQA